MNKFLSDVAVNSKSSEIRELLKLGADKEIISFGGGLPSPDAFPVADIQDAINDAIDKHGFNTMQYGETEGLPELIDEVSKIMKSRNLKSNDKNIMITTGSQQGLDLCGKLLINEGDHIICESPTYLAAISAFKSYKPKIIEIPMDDDGIKIDIVEKKLSEYPIKFIYLIPDFQNPTGRSMSIERRKDIIKLANKHNVLIIEDSPYSELSYDSDVLPTIKSLDTEGRVIYLSTFSKIICPGFRLGWIFAEEPFFTKLVILKQGLDLHTNQFVQYVVSTYLKKYDIADQINSVKKLYRVKRDAMVEAIEKYFPKEVYHSNPLGGMFIWVEVPKEINTRDLFEKAVKRKVAFVSGGAFYPNGGSENGIRINFSNASLEEIEKGIKILGELITEEVEKLKS